jgi:hypothetical protein
VPRKIPSVIKIASATSTVAMVNVRFLFMLFFSSLIVWVFPIELKLTVGSQIRRTEMFYCLAALIMIRC